MGENTEENMGTGAEIQADNRVTSSADVNTANAFKSVVSASSTTAATTLLDIDLRRSAPDASGAYVSHSVRKRRRPGDPAIVRICRQCGNPFRFRRTTTPKNAIARRLEASSPSPAAKGVRK